METQTSSQIVEPKEEQKIKTMIEVDENLLPAPKTTAELKTVLETIAKGGGFPEIFNTPEKRIAGYSLGRALLGDKWQLALNNMYYHKGKLCIFGELPGGLAEHTRQVEEKEIYCIDKDYKRICLAEKNLNAEPFSGICIIQREGRVKKEFFFTLEDARSAGLYPAKPEAAWTKHTKTMLERRAMQKAIKFEFPDAVMGVPMMEHAYGIAPDLEPKNIRDVESIDRVNETLEKTEKPPVPQFNEIQDINHGE